MARLLSLTTLAILASMALGGCGTGSGGTQGAGPTTAGGGGTATGGPAATSGLIGSGPIDACSLLTGGEAGGALHVEALTATGTAGDPGGCSFSLATGEEALAIDVMRNGAEAQYQTFINSGSAEEVQGVGDKALWERGTRRLLFRVGDLLIYVFPRYINGADAALEASTAIGKIIAARLTTGAVPSGLAATPPPMATAQTACELMSADEAAGVLGQGSLKAEANEFAQQFCSYGIVSTGEVVISTYFKRTGGSDAWASLVGSLTTNPVSGLGEKAVFEPSTNILFVLQGDSILDVNVTTVGLDPGTALEQGGQLARIMLTHL